MSSDAESNGSQVIARAAKILHALEVHPGGRTISQLSRETALPRTTVHRLVTSLESQQLLIAGASGVRLGPALARLAASAHTDIISLSRASIETLGRRTRETVDLSVYRGSHAVSVSQYTSDQELRVVSAVGTAFPCHCTAHGKAILANFSDKQVSDLIGTRPDVRTKNTLSTLPEILEELRETREAGYAIDCEEHARGVCGIGVHLDIGLHEHYAVSIAVPAIRFEEKLDLLLSSLLQCKAEIEASIR
ncbi:MULTISPECIES: IclR family transcriptional regulator [Enterobacteriaceae]|uniref:IclR family transcriptional regulator n=1 Tax=Enterobacteriaceae TaxID=543 RepID=UPI000C75ABD5|nr:MULTISPECIES: IclR family transcriptional regulator [Enterobacteriaceae]HAN1838214.1 IclR family transcriptional regulator [Escherichia coli]HBC5611334.1 IclR family transcriptional regulator [Klebsiella oxytoca]HDG1673927.1 IclR family transcriptional regulator [Kluyvera cryocrescens]HEF0063615.1 IclR family transcriptional regulator [Citrobacter pasteurii]EKV7299111.1 IclR family transcriptional regulator [Citrobacter farmeri]